MKNRNLVNNTKNFVVCTIILSVICVPATIFFANEGRTAAAIIVGALAPAGGIGATAIHAYTGCTCVGAEYFDRFIGNPAKAVCRAIAGRKSK